MKSDTFRFKKFEVCQSRSAMKVGMDGVTLGAWAFDSCPDRDSMVIWDIGTGTGLISMMLAQRFPNSSITAVEIDRDAASEAADNAARSIFSERIRIVDGDIFEIAGYLPKPYAVVCNPPYFRDSLSAPDRSRNLARHEGKLGAETLIRLCSAVLPDNGLLSMILPCAHAEIVEFNAAMSRMSVDRKTDLVSIEGKNPVRTLWQLSKGTRGRDLRDSLTIKTIDGTYTPEYHDMTKDFYL